MKTKLILLLGVLSLCLLMTCPAQTILKVTGSNDLVRVLVSDDAAAAAFTLSSGASNLAISAELEFYGASPVAFLSSGLDVGFQPEDLIAARSVSSNLLFTGISLPAGTYFLVIANYQGALLWHASRSPTVTNAGGASRIVDFFSDEAEPIAPGSLFTVAVDRALHYELTVVPAPVFTACYVPAPGQFRLQATGAAGLTYTLQTSTNMVNWVNHTNLPAGPGGLIECVENMEPNAPANFYRLRWP